MITSYISEDFVRDHPKVDRDFVIRVEEFLTGKKYLGSSIILGELTGEEIANKLTGKAYFKGLDQCELKLRGRYIFTFIRK